MAAWPFGMVMEWRKWAFRFRRRLKARSRADIVKYLDMFQRGNYDTPAIRH